jgi:hypothetical protein
MQRTRRIGWVLAAGVVLACPGAAPAATPDGSTVFELSQSTKAAKRLAAADVRISASGAADATAGRITFPVTGAQIASAARLDHGGALALRKGKRSVTLRSLRTSLGSRPRVTAVLGKRRITFLTLAVPRSKPLTLDAVAGVAAGSGLRASLSHTTVRALRKRLKARRLKAGRIGTVDVNGRLLPDTVAPPPRTEDPAPQPTPTPTPAPDPTTEPIGHTEWIASTLPGTNDLKSFTDYLHMSFPPVPPATQGGPGSVVASSGAARIAADNPYDHRLDIRSAAREADGSVVIQHDAQIDYLMPAHSIDNRLVDPAVVIAPGGATAKVLASGHATDRDTAGAPPTPFSDEHLLDLDLSGVVPELGDDGTRTWHDVPAVVAASGEDEIGYDAGSQWGSWTITVPAADTDPGAAPVTGTSSFAMRASWVNYILNVPPGGTITPAGGTTATTTGVFAAPLTGTFERGSRTGTVDLAGSVRYHKPAHGIDITVADTKVAIDGDTATVSALVTPGGSRIDIATIDLSAVTPTETPGSITWTDALATFTAAGGTVFTYAAGEEYGKLTLTLETP